MKIFTKKQTSGGPAPGDVERTVACFKDGLNCTQAVLSTYGPHYGLDREQALKVAGAFGSGMGMGETCGAVTGALMVIGLKHTRVKGGGLFSKERTRDLTREFTARFKARNKTTMCRELLGCDPGTEEGVKTAQKEKHFKKRCPTFVQEAAEILEEILKE